MDYTKEQFEEKYAEIVASLIKDKVKKKNHAVIFLGGQPGSGKSNFYSQDNNLNGYIVIDGDQYRKYHPHYEDIIKYDFDNYVERTQPFVNRCIERLIDELSDEGYNLLIEGTLRDPHVPIRTCTLLKVKGYTADLFVIGMNASEAWESTINRAKLLESMGEIPRTVPIDKYNFIVNVLPNNLAFIESSGLFESIKIIDRNNRILYDSMGHQGIGIDKVLSGILDLKEWNECYPQKANEFLEQKIELLRNEVRRRTYGR